MNRFTYIIRNKSAKVWVGYLYSNGLKKRACDGNNPARLIAHLKRFADADHLGILTRQEERAIIGTCRAFEKLGPQSHWADLIGDTLRKYNASKMADTLEDVTKYKEMAKYL